MCVMFLLIELLQARTSGSVVGCEHEGFLQFSPCLAEATQDDERVREVRMVPWIGWR